MEQANKMLYQLRQANTVRQKEWDPTDAITLAFRGNELAGEVGEACNVIKKLERERIGLRGTRATAAQLAEELADIIICVDLIAMHAGIDLEQAVQQKFNETSAKYGLRTQITDRLTGSQ
jgi:NTP pyrophosphatase (non-canonical NTP hydrolase)